MVADKGLLGIAEAEQFALGVLHIGGASFGTVTQAVLVHAGDAGDAPGKADGGLTGVATGLDVAGGAQFGEHFGFAFDAPSLAAQGALFTRGVGAAVGVALGDDALLLAAAQLLGNGARQMAALGGLQAADERGEPAAQVVDEVTHLAGTCLDLEPTEPPKQEICCSRAFGTRLRELQPIWEAVATYAARACEKLRRQGSLCKKVRVSIRTGMFNPDEPKFARGIICELPYPTDDTREITKAAVAGLEHVFREGFAFSKAEVLLMDLRQRGEFTDDMFAATQPATSEKVMQVMDTINAKWGKGTVRPGGVPASPAWGMRRELMSPSYTTRLDQLWTVYAK